jgi:hypothetical protein
MDYELMMDIGNLALSQLVFALAKTNCDIQKPVTEKGMGC